MSKLSVLLGAAALFVLAGQASAADGGGGAPLATTTSAVTTPAPLDPRYLLLTPPKDIKWTGNPATAQTAVLAGDPNKEGSLYVMLIKWGPNSSSRPHSHPHERYITVLEGTWWVGTGEKYSPETMTPVQAGGFVVHPAGGIHYDGTKGAPALIEIVGIGPATMIPREVPPQPPRNPPPKPQ